MTPTIEKIKKSKEYKKIMKIVENNKSISKRQSALFKENFSLDNCPMGSGGVGQVRIVKGVARVQVSYGIGLHNYATVVLLSI